MHLQPALPCNVKPTGLATPHVLEVLQLHKAGIFAGDWRRLRYSRAVDHLLTFTTVIRSHSHLSLSLSQTFK